MIYTYVLKSKKDNRFYTGYTKDLIRRLKEHNNGKTFSTSHRGLFVLIYYEACVDQEDAIKREKYLKSAWGKRYLKNRLRNYLLGLTP